MDADFPAPLWLFAIYIGAPYAAVLGLIWIAGRVLYLTGYSQAAAKRGRGLQFRLLLASCSGPAHWARSCGGWCRREGVRRHEHTSGCYLAACASLGSPAPLRSMEKLIGTP